MDSITIELLRFGGSAGIVDPMNNYLVLAGDKMPPGARAINLQHKTLLRHLHHLRYPGNNPPEKVEEALSILSREADYLLRLPETLSTPLQIDLVTSAAELWAFPFEALLHIDRFKNDPGGIVITRRIRGEFNDEKTDWPIQPRVLFAFASPDYIDAKPVPSEPHKAALRAALKPWIEPLIIPNFPSAIPDETSVLTILEEASLEDISNAIKEGHDKKKPYTHVHILAHGVKAEAEYAHESLYGLGLKSDSGAVHPFQLGEALRSVDGRPVCVSLAVCDGGNQHNTIAPGSLAQSLHENGIPIVIASQFPLTMPGSSILAETFYTNLLNGEDVRNAILSTRKNLSAAENDGALHDWLSMVSYVQLPEGYSDYLDEYSLKRQFASLRNVQKWADHIIRNNITDPNALAYVEGALGSRIDKLLAEFESDKFKGVPGAYEELTGLLGSAFKRRAELEAYLASVDDDADSWRKKSIDSLRQSAEYYRKGHDHNLSAHWNGIQRLSLTAVLEGTVDESYLTVVEVAASKATENEGEIWAHGTLAEVYLLSSLSSKGPQLGNAKDHLSTLKSKAEASGDLYPIESTQRQLQKYVDWWTKENGFFGDKDSDLSADAAELIQLLT